ncbi:TTL4, partial [Symbiodinium necroappetens]
NRAVCLASLQDWEGTRNDAAKALARVTDLSAAAMKKALFQKARAELRLQLQTECQAQHSEIWRARIALRRQATLSLAEQLGVRTEAWDAGPKRVGPGARARACGQMRRCGQRCEGRAPPQCVGISVLFLLLSVVKALPRQTEPAAAPAASREAQQAMHGHAKALHGTEGKKFRLGQAAAPHAPAEALRAKEAGTAQYKEGNYRGALMEYRRALDLVDQDAALRAQLLGNVAAACLMLKRTSETVDACKECLALDPSNAKVRARLASAQVATGDFEAARATLGNAGDDPVLANALKQIGSTQSTLAEADQALSSGEPAKALNIYANLESSVLFDFPPLTMKMAQCYL